MKIKITFVTLNLLIQIQRKYNKIRGCVLAVVAGELQRPHVGSGRQTDSHLKSSLEKPSLLYRKGQGISPCVQIHSWLQNTGSCFPVLLSMLSQQLCKIPSLKLLGVLGKKEGRLLTETETWLNEFHKEGSQVSGQTSSEEDSLKNLAQSIMQKSRMKGATLRDVSASLWTDNLEPGLPGRCEVNFAKNSALGSVQWT